VTSAFFPAWDKWGKGGFEPKFSFRENRAMPLSDKTLVMLTARCNYFEKPNLELIAVIL
jgi:hypothetical protein